MLFSPPPPHQVLPPYPQRGLVKGYSSYSILFCHQNAIDAKGECDLVVFFQQVQPLACGQTKVQAAETQEGRLVREDLGGNISEGRLRKEDSRGKLKKENVGGKNHEERRFMREDFGRKTWGGGLSLIHI